MSNKLLVSDNPYSLFRLPEALTCWQAVLVGGAAYLIAALLFALGGLLAKVSFIFTALFGLVALVVVLAGVNGAGICLTDMVNRRPYRGVLGYMLAGLFSLPKLLGAGLLLGLVYLGVLLLVALVLLICKLPGVGPLLLVGAIPALVLLMALTIVGFYMASSIVAPAIWDGERVMHALSITWAITRKHPFEALAKIIGGLFLSLLFASLLFGLLTFASLVVGGLAVPIIGVGMHMDFGALFGGYGSGGGHMVGAAIGYGLVYATASAFVFLLPMMVGILTWREFSGKVDLDSIRQQADTALKQAGEKVTELKETAATVAAPAPAPAPAPQPAPAPAAPHCPQCQGEVQVGDRFCEHCGHKLV